MKISQHKNKGIPFLKHLQALVPLNVLNFSYLLKHHYRRCSGLVVDSISSKCSKLTTGCLNDFVTNNKFY